jgi:hypothetical protein
MELEGRQKADDPVWKQTACLGKCLLLAEIGSRDYIQSSANLLDRPGSHEALEERSGDTVRRQIFRTENTTATSQIYDFS